MPETTAPLRPVQIPEAVTASWSPPATVSTWGFRVPLESIRFAAANHLCVELGYQGTFRLVEPYAFRQSRAGDLLFCAVKVENGETRNYRLDRIQSVKVSNKTFSPRFLVEVGTISDYGAPPLNRKGSSKW